MSEYREIRGSLQGERCEHKSWADLCEKCEIERLRAENEPALTQWQPIETAPRDESHFLAIRWPEGSPLPNAICWNPWINNFSGNAGPDAKPVVFQPTHWMPLPPPPSGSWENRDD